MTVGLGTKTTYNAGWDFQNKGCQRAFHILWQFAVFFTYATELSDHPPRPPYTWTFLLLSKRLRELPELFRRGETIASIVGSEDGLVKSLCLWESSGATGPHCCSYSISTILHAPSLILLSLSSLPLISLFSPPLFSPTLSVPSISLHFLCVVPSVVFLINIDLAVIVGQQGPHISITSNYTHAHTLRHARARTHARELSINLIASSTHNAPEPRPTNYNSNLTSSINMGAILPGWTLVEWKMQINIVRHFLWSPLFSPRRPFLFSSCVL